MTAPIARVTRSVISGPDTQAAIWFLGALSQPRVSGGQTGGAFALADHLARRGNASPVHVHNRDNETFFVLDGELRVFAGEEEHTAGPGTVAVLPRCVSHAYVVTTATARFLTLAHPGRVRAVRHRGRRARPGPHPAAACRTTGLRRAGAGLRPAPDHDLDSAAPALEPLRLAAWTAGRRPSHGWAASSCAASRMSVASSPNRPRKCTPIGRPSSFHHSGTDIAGLPVRLATMPA